ADGVGARSVVGFPSDCSGAWSTSARCGRCWLEWRVSTRSRCSSCRLLKMMQAVEPLATDAGDPALGVSVRVRCPDRRADHGDPFALEDVIAAATELGVEI